jgi:hypothetical protein
MVTGDGISYGFRNNKGKRQIVAVRMKRNIGNQRFYATENVFRSAHLVPTKSRTEAEGVALYFMLTTMSVKHI